MKLSKAHRAAILKAAIDKSGLLFERDKVKVAYADWAETARRSVIPANTNDLISKAKNVIKDLPSDLGVFVRYNTRGSIRANVGGARRVIYWDGSFSNPVSYEDRLCPDEIVIAGDSEAADKWARIDATYDKVSSGIDHLSATLTAVLSSVTTTEQLIKVWPESVAFIPGAIKASEPKLPALPIEELNKMIGLTREQMK